MLRVFALPFVMYDAKMLPVCINLYSFACVSETRCFYFVKSINILYLGFLCHA